MVDQLNYLRAVNDQYLSALSDDSNRWIKLTAIAPYPPYLRLDATLLRFLIRGADANLLLDLKQAERLTDVVRDSLARRFDIHFNEVQTRLDAVQAEHPFPDALSLQAIEEALGPRLVHTLKQVTDDIYTSLGQALKANEAAFVALRNHLKKRHPRTKIIDRRVVGQESRSPTT